MKFRTVWASSIFSC